MSEIPEDIEAAAKECCDALPIVYDGWDEDAVMDCIAKAILAERERCAKIAYAYGADHSESHRLAGHSISRLILYGTSPS